MPDNRIIEVDGVRYFCFPAEEAIAIFSDLCARMEEVSRVGAPVRTLRTNGTGIQHPTDSEANLSEQAIEAAVICAPVTPTRVKAASAPVAAVVRSPERQPPRDSTPSRAVAASTVYSQVLQVIKFLGECDIAAIVAEMEQRGLPLGEDPEKQVGNAIHASLKPKGLIEKTGKFGYWRAV